MHYLYLPTNWCKNNKISNESTVMVSQNWNGDLLVSPQLVEKKPSKFRIPESKVIPYVTKSHESDLLEKEAILELVADILSIRRSLV